MYPVLLHVGHLILPTFGVLAAVGLLAGMALSLWTARRCGLSPDAVWNAGLFAIVAAFVGSRLLLVLSNLRSFRMAPILLLTVPSLTAGGLASTVVVTVIRLRRLGLPVLRTFDAWAAPGVLVWAALALGHLAEGSDPGLPVRRWGLHTSAAGYREQPVALYVCLAALALTALLLWRVRRPARPGWIAGWALLGAGVVQFLLSFLRLPFLYAGPTPLALLDPIQWVALTLVAAGGLLLSLPASTAALSSEPVPATGKPGSLPSAAAVSRSSTPSSSPWPSPAQPSKEL